MTLFLPTSMLSSHHFSACRAHHKQDTKKRTFSDTKIPNGKSQTSGASRPAPNILSKITRLADCFAACSSIS
jgi:hypothetical protein